MDVSEVVKMERAKMDVVNRFSVVVAVVVVCWFGFGATAGAGEGEEPVEQPADQQIGEQTDADGGQYDRLGLEQPSGLARAELASFQTIHGMVLAIQMCAVLDCDLESRSGVGGLTLGAGVGLGSSLLATGEGIYPGRAAAINSGVLWGGWLALMTTASIDDRADGDVVAGAMAAGQLGGLAGAVGLAEWLRPTSGDVTTVNQGGVWASLYYLLVVGGIIEPDWSSQAFLAGLTTTSLVGGFGGLMLARHMPMSRGRAVVTSSGGLLGGLLGVAAPYMVLDDDITLRVASSGMTVGSLAGLLTSGYLTRNWDDDQDYPSPAFGVQPASDDGGWLGVISGRW